MFSPNQSDESSRPQPGQTQVESPTKGDVFIRKYDHNGTELWTSQFGTTGFDRANSVAVSSSGVYVVGDAGGVLPDAQLESTFSDFFGRRYDVTGKVLWTRQFGPGTHLTSAAADTTGVYVAGFMGGGNMPGQTSSGGYDGYVRKYDLGGNLQWTHQYGIGVNDEAHGAAADGTAFTLREKSPVTSTPSRGRSRRRRA